MGYSLAITYIYYIPVPPASRQTTTDFLLVGFSFSHTCCHLAITSTDPSLPSGMPKAALRAAPIPTSFVYRLRPVVSTDELSCLTKAIGHAFYLQ